MNFEQNYKFESIERTMNDDPLRFLKPRKKQFHLTPTKPVNQSSKNQQDIFLKKSKTSQQNNKSQLNTQSLLESNDIKNQVFNLKNNVELSELISNSNIIKDSSINLRNYKPTLNTNQYNPQKYFSSAVQNYLRKKRGLPQQQQQKSKVHPQEKVQLYTSNTDLSQQEESIQFNQRIQMTKINQQQKIQIEHNNASPLNQLQTTRDKHYQQTNRFKLRQSNSYQKEHITEQRKNQFQQISFNQNIDKKPSAFTNKIQPFTCMDDQQEEEEQTDIVQLKACPVCGRKFNPNSYEKHVKVCEKVFVKKRKQFSSEKQRSLSTKKK